MEDKRYKTILRVSIANILANILLAAFKAVLGLLSHSIAVILDAVNNISDAGSSAITIVGTRLAAKEPDRKHPFGYGRIEYLSALVISALILYAGATSLIESVKKIITPEVSDYSVITLVILAAAILVKIVLGRFVKSTGRKVKSDSMIASGSEAALDALVSAATLTAALLRLTLHISIEAWLAAAISCLIIRSGLKQLGETVSKLLGERAEPELIAALKNTVSSFEEVQGCFDVILNNYGPDRHMGSLHIAVPDSMTADQADDLIRRISDRVRQEHHVTLTAVSLYSVNTRSEAVIAVRNEVEHQAMSVPGINSMHGFYLNTERGQLRFDLVVSFDVPSRKGAFSDAVEKVRRAFPDYDVNAVMDTDFNELC